MRHKLTRAIATVGMLIVAGVGLSACVTGGYGYDPNPRYGYYDRRDHRWHDRQAWVDRDGDGRRDWWEYRR